MDPDRRERSSRQRAQPTAWLDGDEQDRVAWRRRRTRACIPRRQSESDARLTEIRARRVRKRQGVALAALYPQRAYRADASEDARCPHCPRPGAAGGCGSATGGSRVAGQEELSENLQRSNLKVLDPRARTDLCHQARGSATPSATRPAGVRRGRPGPLFEIFLRLCRITSSDQRGRQLICQVQGGSSGAEEAPRLSSPARSAPGAVGRRKDRTLAKVHYLCFGAGVRSRSRCNARKLQCSRRRATANGFEAIRRPPTHSLPSHASRIASRPASIRIKPWASAVLDHGGETDQPERLPDSNPSEKISAEAST